MNTRKYLKGLFLLATLLLAGCGDESESTPAAPDNSVENSGMAGTDSLDNTVFSCHDSNKQRVWNLTTVNRENPEIYAIELATYMAQETFYSILQDTVAQNHFESEEETYTEGTPSCLIDLIYEVSDFPGWLYETYDSIPSEIVCSDGSVHPKDEYIIHTERLKNYGVDNFDQAFDSTYESTLKEFRVRLDSCMR
ncbi:MAG: hypothetical protein J5615_07380 [Fibrobacter sp.]|nr:hypothetical protein [Fibrobacter sp.]